MARPIPVQNIYYLLLYAWNRLPEGGAVDVSGVQSPELPNLLTKVLLDGTRHLLRRGLDRDYRESDEDLSRPRGRMRLGDTLSRGLLGKVQVACTTDDLSRNVLQNQILKTTLDHLTKTINLDEKLREELFATLAAIDEVDTIKIRSRDFFSIRMHGNNALYGLLLKVCELVHQALLPSPDGRRFAFRDIFAESQTMGRIFQDFVRNFYKLEQKRFVVSGEMLRWPVDAAVGRGHEYFPTMRTDVSLKSDRRTILIECKWTPDTFQYNYGTKSLRSEHLYQLHTYVAYHPMSQIASNSVEGILLYPETAVPVDVNVRISDHWIGARTIDFSADWTDIRRELLQLIDVAS